MYENLLLAITLVLVSSVGTLSAMEKEQKGASSVQVGKGSEEERQLIFDKFIDALIEMNPQSVEKIAAKKDDIMEMYLLDGYLNLSGLNITILPDSVGNLTYIGSIGLSMNPISSLPSSIGKLVGVVRFYVDKTPLSEIFGKGVWDQQDIKEYAQSVMETEQKRASSVQVGKGSGDEQLALVEKFIDDLIEMNPQSKTKIEAGKKEIIDGYLTYRYLNLKDLDIAILPNSIGNLSYLVSITLSKNRLLSLPSSVGNLVGLERFYVQDTPLSEIFQKGVWDQQDIKEYAQSVMETEQNGASSVQARKGPENELRVIAEKFIDDLSEMNPQSAYKIKNNKDMILNLYLKDEYLYLEGLDITILPDSIGNQSSIKSINLKKTSLLSLPFSIGKLVGVKEINFAGTPLEETFGTNRWFQQDIQKYVQQHLKNVKSGGDAKLFLEQGVKDSKFEELPADVRKEILEKMAEKSRKEIGK